MNYEQKYKEALERAKKFYNNEGCRVGMTPVDLEVIFPELEESEDERMRKSIIYALRNGGFYDHDKTDEAIAWLEKQGEQKPADEAEPKFNLYDWVVTDKSDIVQIGAVNNGYYTLFNGMDFNMSYVDKCWHLWTFQDAKDGDILCTYECGKPKIVFILKLKGISKKPYVLKYHCYYNIMYPYFESDSETGCLAVNDGDLKPATKEQRDILFEKMKLEGYRWDEDEKELIKL